MGIEIKPLGNPMNMMDTYSYEDAMRRKNKLCLMVGRFGHFHSGHYEIAMEALKRSEKLLILVGSSQESGTIRNPFKASTRIHLIKKVFENFFNVYIGFIPDMTHEDDINFEWGKWVLDHVEMWRAIYNLPPMDAMVYGNDENRKGWFAPEDIEGVRNIVINRENNPVSATKMRELMAKGELLEWTWNAPYWIHNHFDHLREELLKVPYYKEMSENV